MEDGSAAVVEKEDAQIAAQFLLRERRLVVECTQVSDDAVDAFCGMCQSKADGGGQCAFNAVETAIAMYIVVCVNASVSHSHTVGITEGGRGAYVLLKQLCGTHG